MLVSPSQAYRPHRSGSSKLGMTEMARELIACVSLQACSDELAGIGSIDGVLPVGMPICVTPGRGSLADQLDGLITVRARGFEPILSLAARRVASRGELCAFLKRAVWAARISTIHLVDGGAAQPLGPYANVASMLQDDLLADCGLRQLGLVGDPGASDCLMEGSSNDALLENCILAQRRGLSPYVVTQYTFVANHIVRLCLELERSLAGVPIHAGIPAPSGFFTPQALQQRCPLNTPPAAAHSVEMGERGQGPFTDATDQLLALAYRVRMGSLPNLVGLHLYSLGDLTGAAAWINQRLTDGFK